MTQQQTTETSKRIKRAVVIAVAIVVLLLSLDLSATQISTAFSSFFTQAVALLPSVALAAVQALRPDSAAQHQFSLCSLQTLLFWPLLQTAAKLA